MTECIQGSFFFSRNFEKFVKNEIGRARTIWEGQRSFSHVNV